MDNYKRKYRILLEASKDDRLSRGALAVLGYVLDNQEDGQRDTAAAHSDIASFAGLSVTNVSKAIARLESAGYLATVERGNKIRPSRYRATMPMVDEDDMSKSTYVGDDMSVSTHVEANNTIEPDDEPFEGIVSIIGATQDGSLLTMEWELHDKRQLSAEIDLGSVDGAERLDMLTGAARVTLNDNKAIPDQLLNAMFRIDRDGELSPF